MPAKGLHYGYRKNILDKIEADNQKIAKKLFTLKPDSLTDHRNLDRDFAGHLKYRNNIISIRKKIVPVTNGRFGRLPPISE
jgi:hypothetical protein